MICFSLAISNTGYLYFPPMAMKRKNACSTAVWYITSIQNHYVRPSSTVSRLSRRNFSWYSQYSKSPSGDWMVSRLAGLQRLTVLNMLIRGITITLTGDWYSGRQAALSPAIMLRTCKSLLTDGKIRHISVLWMWGLTKIMFQFLNTTVT